MKLSLLNHLLSFFGGFIIVFAVSWTVSKSETVSSSTTAADTTFNASGRVGDRPVALEIPGSGKSVDAQKRVRIMMDTALNAIRTSGKQERAARWSLLLSQLRQEGDLGFRAMAEFLATGEDLPLGDRIDLPGISVRGPSSLRMAVLDRISNLHTPEARKLRRNETLRSLRMNGSLDDVVRNIARLEYVERGAHREEAIAAVQRIAGSSSHPDDVANIGRILARYRAVELLPLMETRSLADPAKHLSNYLGVLWALPADRRQEVTERLLSKLTVLPPEQEKVTLSTLDYRIPAAFEFTANWFAQARSTGAKSAVIEQLGSNRGWAPNFSFQGDGWGPDSNVGTPGTRPQVEARLALLEQIAQYCPEPFLQAKLATARASLEKQIAGKR